jgi:hypothetical protein
VVCSAGGCAKDVVLQADSVCGDLQVDPGEECDLESAGCVECQVAAGWTCDDSDCRTTCGDDVLVGDEECEPPDGVTCDSSCRSAQKSEACDVTGFWISRETNYSVDDVLNQTQVSANWYVYQLQQSGDRFEVVRSISCGIQVTGTTSVELSEAGTRALMWLNPMDADSPRGARGGTFVADGEGCSFSMDRQYMVRGLEERFLPPDFSTHPDLDSLTPLPTVDDPESSTGPVDGAVDTDGDGFPGVAFIISGNASGIRNVAMRDWAEYYPSAEYPIPTQAIEFDAACRYANQESILHVSHCPLLGCGILLAGSAPAVNGHHHVTFRYLGQDSTEPRVASVIVAEMKTDEDADYQTCKNARLALPLEDAGG